MYMYECTQVKVCVYVYVLDYTYVYEDDGAYVCVGVYIHTYIHYEHVWVCLLYYICMYSWEYANVYMLKCAYV